jgi:endonuclease YncB( thermonuclease family)
MAPFGAALVKRKTAQAQEVAAKAWHVNGARPVWRGHDGDASVSAMRKIAWPAVGLLGLAIIVGGVLLYRATPASQPAAEPAPASPSAAASAPVPLRPITDGLAVQQAPPATEIPPAGTPPAAAAPPTPDAPRTADMPAPPATPTSGGALADASGATPPSATPPAEEPLTAPPLTAQPLTAPPLTAQPSPRPPAAAKAAPGSDLPVVAVAPRVVHVVPEKEALEAPPVTVTDRNGRVMSHIVPRPASPAVAAGPPPRGPAPVQLAGPAPSTTVINVSGQPVRLFGVRPADASDVCLAKAGRAQPCAEVAREAVAARLGTFSAVHCRTPPGQRGDSASICLDGAGVDIAGFLVGEGLALANPRESNDYVGAEGVARANKRGLWRYR